MPTEVSPAKLPAQSSETKFPRSLLIVWIFAVLIGVGLALTRIPSVFLEGEVHPLGNDGFYHATRILAIAKDATSTHAFDSNLHWPEGLWVTWPWAYDYLGGVLTGMMSSDRLSATKIMVFYPLLWLIANITLVGMIAREVLKPRMAVVGIIAYAAAPLTLSLHALGKMDHHSAELFWLLLSMYLAGRWMKLPESTRTPVALGIALAVATAFHNILFLLQIPVLGCLLIARLSGYPTPTLHKTILFGISLLVTQFLVLLPSHQFATFEYAFYYQSWFHLHVAFLTAMAALALSCKNKLTMWVTLGIAGLLALPAADQVLYGLSFINSELPMFDVLKETQAPFGGGFSIQGINYFYSGLIWLLPICIGYAIYQTVTRNAKGMMLILMVFSTLGLVLLTSQVRFHNFGYVFLILLPLLMLQQLLPKGRDALISSAIIFAAYTFSLSHYLIPPKPGNSQRYSTGLPLIKAAQLQCEKQPGLLLADNNWGNFFRYQTQCPLLSNNFIITKKDFEYINLTVKLMRQSPEELRIIAPDIRYVLVSHADNNKLGDYLLSDRTFDGFEIVGEIRKNSGEVYSRFYRVGPVPHE